MTANQKGETAPIFAERVAVQSSFHIISLDISLSLTSDFRNFLRIIWRSATSTETKIGLHFEAVSSLGLNFLSSRTYLIHSTPSIPTSRPCGKRINWKNLLNIILSIKSFSPTMHIRKATINSV